MPTPPIAATRRMQVERAVRARGIASEARVSDYYRVKGKRKTLAPAIEELVGEGVLERLRMRELGDAWLVPAEDADRAIAGDDQADRRIPALAVRQPGVGPLRGRAPVRLRASPRDLQAARTTRIYGYYVLPLLDGPDVVGRIDLKADRKAGTLRALAVHWQKRPRPRALREALARLASVLGLERSEIESGV